MTAATSHCAPPPPTQQSRGMTSAEALDLPKPPRPERPQVVQAVHALVEPVHHPAVQLLLPPPEPVLVIELTGPEPFFQIEAPIPGTVHPLHRTVHGIQPEPLAVVAEARNRADEDPRCAEVIAPEGTSHPAPGAQHLRPPGRIGGGRVLGAGDGHGTPHEQRRSEEDTSEIQSR